MDDLADAAWRVVALHTRGTPAGHFIAHCMRPCGRAWLSSYAEALGGGEGAAEGLRAAAACVRYPSAFEARSDYSFEEAREVMRAVSDAGLPFNELNVLVGREYLRAASGEQRRDAALLRAAVVIAQYEMAMMRYVESGLRNAKSSGTSTLGPDATDRSEDRVERQTEMLTRLHAACCTSDAAKACHLLSSLRAAPRPGLAAALRRTLDRCRRSKRAGCAARRVTEMLTDALLDRRVAST